MNRTCPQGQMVFLPLSVPFPVPEIGSAIEIETNQEYWGVDFAITDSNYRFADYVDETVKVYFLTGCLRSSTRIHMRRGNQFSAMLNVRDGPWPSIRVGVKIGVRHVKVPKELPILFGPFVHVHTCLSAVN